VSELRANDIAFGFGEFPVLRDASLVVSPGETVGLIGPNGAGKTTLVRVLAGLLEAAGGQVSLGGRALAELGDRERARSLAYLPQGAPAHWPLQVERVVELGRIPHRAWWQRLGEEDRAAIEQAMADADVEALRGRLVTQLSGGERTRVMLARVFASRPGIILADEPVASLDPFHQLRVMHTLRECARRGGGVLVVMHDLNLAARYCDRLVALHRGRVIAEGPPRKVLDDPALAAAYSVNIELINHPGGFWVRFR
jgi:iron complex transport system ATP-binding protein